MLETPKIKVEWRPRDTPLTPIAVAARGDAARALARRALERTDEALAELSGVASQDALILIGKQDLLPWVDGVVYLGRDEAAPSLLLPTTSQPGITVQLFEGALMIRFKNQSPLAVLLDPPTLIPVSAARPVSRESLVGWLGGGR
jgi:hypothetical protein